MKQCQYNNGGNKGFIYRGLRGDLCLFSKLNHIVYFMDVARRTPKKNNPYEIDTSEIEK